MKRFIYMLLLLSVQSLTIWANPSSLYWTNCTTSVIPTGTGVFEVDNFYTLFPRKGHAMSFPPDVGFDAGIFTWNNLSAEFGFDFFGGTANPLFFNGKIGMEENKLFTHAPSFSIGIFDVGTSTKTNFNIINLVFGKSLPKSIGGTMYVSGYSGSKTLGKNHQGFMVGYERILSTEKNSKGKEYNKWIFDADYASGKNPIGGGGFALTYYFTPDIAVQFGSTWFNNAKTNGFWKMGLILYFNIPLFEVEAKSGPSAGGSAGMGMGSSSNVKAGLGKDSDVSKDKDKTKSGLGKDSDFSKDAVH